MTKLEEAKAGLAILLAYVSAPAGRPLAWRWRLQNGAGAYAPNHFPPQEGIVTFQPGQTEQMIEVRTNRDLGIGNSAYFVVAWTDNHPPVPVTVTGLIREAIARPAVAPLGQPAYPAAPGAGWKSEMTVDYLKVWR